MKIIKAFMVLATLVVSVQTFAEDCIPHVKCPTPPPQAPTVPAKDDCIPHVDCSPRPVPAPQKPSRPGSSIGCRPLVNCPGDMDRPNLPGSGPVIPVEVELTVIGYSEIPSPTCDEEDLEQALKNAKAQAVKEAQMRLGKDAVIMGEFRFSKRCGQGIYSNSVEGNSWIVQAFAKYKPKK